MRDSLLVSHCVLAGTSIFILNRSKLRTGLTIELATIPYGTVLTHSLISILNHITEEDALNKVCEITKVIRDLFAFPCFVGFLWLKTEYQKEIGYLHPAISLIPFAAYLNNREDQRLINSVMLLNTASCVTISALKENWYGVAAGLTYAVAHGAMHIDNDEIREHKEESSNYILVIFMALAVYAMGFSI